MIPWILISILFNIHSGEVHDPRPVAGFKTPQECIRALEETGPRKPDSKGDIILYECIKNGDTPTVKLVDET